MDCTKINELIQNSSDSLVSCRTVGDAFALTTPFTYPDGDYVEFFVEVKNNGSLVFTDYGETYRYLLDHDFDLFSNKIRREQAAKVASDFSVVMDSIELIKPIDSTDRILDAVIDFGQCIVRLSDFVLMKRNRVENTFQNVVREYFDDSNLVYDTEYPVVTESGSEYKIDFFVRPRNKVPVLLEVISTRSQSNLIQVVEKKVRVWTDISHTPSIQAARVSLIDDSLVSWRHSDITTLGYLSEIYMWSRKDILRTRLA